MTGTVRERPVLAQPQVEPCCGPPQAAPLDVEEAGELARRFAALSDPVRLRLLSLARPTPRTRGRP